MGLCDSNDVMTGCDGGRFGEGVVVGDVLTTTTKPKNGRCHSM